MTEPGFTVSLPDLRGFAKQLDALDGGYEGLGEAIEQLYKQASSLADIKDLVAGLGGILAPTLVAFQDQCDLLVRVHVSACGEVMARSTAGTADRLKRAANAYEKQDKEAEAAIDGGDASKDEKKTAEAITRDDANSDWSTDVDLSGFFTADVDGTVIPEMSFKPTVKKTATTLGEVVGGPSFSSADQVVEYFCGFSPMEEVCKPLLGDWGVLWYVADLFRCVADAVDEISKIMAVGTRKLVGADWTGSAAQDFAASADTWKRVQAMHAQLLRESATRLDDIADQMAEGGKKIAEATLVVADIALEIALAAATGGRSALRKEARDLLLELVMGAPTIIEGIIAFKDHLDLAATDLSKLVSEVASLNPPGNLQDTDA